MSQEFKEVTYRCSKDGCKNEQTVRYFADDKALPVTCCVKCRAGFGKELSEQMTYRLGMFPAR